MIEPNRADTRVKLEPLAKVELRRHLGPIWPPHARKAHSPEQNRVGFLAPVEGGGGQRIAAAKVLAGPHRVFFELEANVFEMAFDCANYLDSFGNHVRANPVAGENRDSVFGL